MKDPKALTFVEMITLVPIPEENGPLCKFMGEHTSYNSGSGVGYGGHVFAQSAWAAAQTVEDGMVIHVRKNHTREYS